MSEALVVDRREQAHGEMLLFGNRPHDVAHGLEHRRHRERRRLLIHELIAALRELDDVARDGRETERRRVDEAELAALHVVHLAALTALQRLGEHEDGRQRRAQVVRHVHEQGEAVVAGELLRKCLRPVRLNRDAHALHRDEQRQQLRVGNVEIAPALHHFTAQQLEKAAAERRVNPGIDLGPHHDGGRRREPRQVNR